MKHLQGKRVVLGVTGGISVYKSLDIVRKLRKAGAEVRVIMTKNATHIVAPLAFRELSGQPVLVDMWAEVTHWNVEHIALAKWADLFLIAPATANCIGKIANGIADDMLTTTVMATQAPVVLAPAMNTQMFENPIVQENMERLRRHGYQLIEPDDGEMACGTCGKGRLPEPARIVFAAEQALSDHLLTGVRVLVTAGGTREPIDPVRFIGNRSSGKMGYALARAAARQGAEVTLVSATDKLDDPPTVRVVHVTSALEMKEAVDAAFDDTDIVMKAAAVADYRPDLVADHKIKKSQDSLHLTLVKNPDILQELGQRKTHQVLVGFAAETRDVLTYGMDKLKRKNLDILVANDVSQPGAGFNTETNIVTLLYPDRPAEALEQMEKEGVADVIVTRAAECYGRLHK